VVFCRFFGYFALLHASLLCELGWVILESLLAGYAAKMEGLTIVSDLELGYLLVQNGNANRTLRHYLNLMKECAFCLLSLVVKKRKKCVKWGGRF
jgi:hypothetical protein